MKAKHWRKLKRIQKRKTELPKIKKKKKYRNITHFPIQVKITIVYNGNNIGQNK